MSAYTCAKCGRNTAGCDRVIHRVDGDDAASMHAECAMGLSWTADVIVEKALTPESVSIVPVSGEPLKASELIAMLGTYIARHGDKDVEVRNPAGDMSNAEIAIVHNSRHGMTFRIETFNPEEE